MIKLFRGLVLVSTAVYLVWVFFPYFHELIYSEVTLDFLEFEGYEAILNLPRFIAWLLVWITVISSLCIFLFLPYSRGLFLGVILVNLSFVILGGLRAHAATEAALLDFVNICTGMIIAISYFTSVSERWKK